MTKIIHSMMVALYKYGKLGAHQISFHGSYEAKVPDCLKSTKKSKL